jgi:ABC-type branched-subunit amino acid transport system substrate-binding protein
MKSIKGLTLCLFFILLFVVTPVLAKKPGSQPITIVTIGDIVAGPWDYIPSRAIADIAIADINDYFMQGNKPYRLQVEIQYAQGRTETHQDCVVDFTYRQEPVNLLLAGRYSGMAQASLPYCNAFNVLMLSPSSTIPYYLTTEDDNLFRLCPSDAYLGASLAHAVWSKGIEHVAFIQNSNVWGDQLYIQFTKEYTALGGSLTGKPIRYLDYEPHYPEQLLEAENQVTSAISTYGASKVGVVLAAFGEASIILNHVKSSFPNLYGCTWFGADGTARSQDILNGAAEAAAHVKLYSLLAKENHGPNWDSVASRFANAAPGQPFITYRANEYDIFWIYALSIEKAGSADPMEVKKVLPKVAAKYEGITGNCKLNQYGDRPNPGFDIWGYVDNPPNCVVSGYVDVNNNVQWLP